jgi:predicted alpha/beta hydrolase family esterase
MKKAVILHGTDGDLGHNWFPWLESKLESEGFKVWVPLLPQNHTPNREVYNDFLLNHDWDFEDNIVIGHSSGAVSVLNLLMDEGCPKIKLGAMVGAWASGTPHGYEEGNQQFINMFPPNGFDFELIKSKAGKLVFMHGDDDPYCPLEQAEYLARNLDAGLTVVPNGGHLGNKFKELPELWKILEPNL